MSEFLKLDRDAHVLTITLNRPAVHNALHVPACNELSAALDEYQLDPELWVAIITGAGERAFCAGHDLLDGFHTPMPSTGWAGLSERTDITKPLIAAVNGMAYGGGCEIALACDLVIADERAVFALSEPRVGFAATGGGITRLVQRVPAAIAMGMLLTGRRVDAAEAHRWGMATEVVPAGTSVEAAKRWANEMMACSPAALRYTKQLAMSVLDGTSSHVSTTNWRREIGAELRRLEDTREGVAAFAEKRKPVWKNR